jgi:hypothetical protein
VYDNNDAWNHELLFFVEFKMCMMMMMLMMLMNHKLQIFSLLHDY